MRDRAVIVVPGDDPVQIQGSPRLAELEAYGEVRVHPTRPRDVVDQVERLRDATILMNSRSALKWPGDVLRQLPKLRFITVFGIGTDAIDVATARAMGIPVSNVPGKTAPVVAEHAFALMLAAAKRVAFQTREIREGRWGSPAHNVYLHGKTLGVLGAGPTAVGIAKMARALEMRVLAWTYHPSAERAADMGAEFVGLERLLRESDAVSLHLPLTPESRGIIGARELGMMKPGALLVNTGRGPLVDDAALVQALNDGHLGGAALDVFEREPLPPDSPILNCEQIVLTPHLADFTPEGIDMLNAGAVANVIAFMEGAPVNVVNG